MSEFERIYKDGLQTEKMINIEKHGDNHSWVTIVNTPPLVRMNIEAPILEKQIKEKGMHPNEKNSGRAIKKSSTRHNKV